MPEAGLALGLAEDRPTFLRTYSRRTESNPIALKTYQFIGKMVLNALANFHNQKWPFGGVVVVCCRVQVLMG